MTPDAFDVDEITSNTDRLTSGVRKLRVRCKWRGVGETQRASLLESLNDAQGMALALVERRIKRPILVDVTFGLVDGRDYQMNLTYLSLTGDADVPIAKRVDAVFRTRRIQVPD